ncbi:NADH dehydrogenase (ubiquinone) Fe-S protein 2 [Tanacetum coccineum]
MDLGDQLRFPVGFEEREKLLEFYERVSEPGCLPVSDDSGVHKICLWLCRDIDSSTQQFASRIDELEEMSTGNRIWKQRLVDIGTVTAQQAKDWGFSGAGWAAHLRMVLVRRTVNGFASGLWARRNRMSSPGWSTCCGHIEMWVEEASKSEGRAVGHVTCTELVADWAFDLIKAEKLAFLLSKSKSRLSSVSEPCGVRSKASRGWRISLSVEKHWEPQFLSSEPFLFPNRLPVGKLDIKRTRGSVRGGASGFQCTASKIRTSLPADHCRPILELGCWIRDPRSRLDQHPTERGQSLEATGWETKRTLGLFLSSSRPRSRSSTKRGISILDHKPLTPSSLGLRALGKGSSDGRPLGVKAKNGLMNRSVRPRTGPIHLLIVEAVRAKRSAFATEKANGQREGSRLSRTLAKLDSHSEALRVSEAL